MPSPFPLTSSLLITTDAHLFLPQHLNHKNPFPSTYLPIKTAPLSFSLHIQNLIGTISLFLTHTKKRATQPIPILSIPPQPPLKTLGQPIVRRDLDRQNHAEVVHKTFTWPRPAFRYRLPVTKSFRTYTNAIVSICYRIYWHHIPSTLQVSRPLIYVRAIILYMLFPRYFFYYVPIIKLVR